MFQASMRLASASGTAHARAWSRMRGASSTRRSGVSFLESSKPTMRRLGLRITAAATTGPNSAPRPASSMPAMRIQPSLRAARSKREEQSRLIRGDFSTRTSPRLQQLLVTQNDHRIDACCPASWNVTRGESDHCEDERDNGKSERIRCADAVQHCGHKSSQPKCSQQANDNADDGHFHSFAQNQTKHFA